MHDRMSHPFSVTTKTHTHTHTITGPLSFPLPPVKACSALVPTPSQHCPPTPASPQLTLQPSVPLLALSPPAGFLSRHLSPRLFVPGQKDRTVVPGRSWLSLISFEKQNCILSSLRQAFQNSSQVERLDQKGRAAVDRAGPRRQGGQSQARTGPLGSQKALRCPPPFSQMQAPSSPTHRSRPWRAWNAVIRDGFLA